MITRADDERRTMYDTRCPEIMSDHVAYRAGPEWALQNPLNLRAWLAQVQKSTLV